MLSIEALQFLVELLVPLVDVVDVGVRIESPAAGVLLPLVDLLLQVVHHSVDRFLGVLMLGHSKRVCIRVESSTPGIDSDKSLKLSKYTKV
jgi:hypothetical protein